MKRSPHVQEALDSIEEFQRRGSSWGTRERLPWWNVQNKRSCRFSGQEAREKRQKPQLESVKKGRSQAEARLGSIPGCGACFHAA